MGIYNRFIVAVDQSTSASKAFLVGESGSILRRASIPHKQMFPMDGRAEHDAEEIYQNVVRALDAVTDGIPARDIAALAIANQRETVVLWERATGKPVHNAIVWQDVRGKDVCARLSASADFVLQTTGMALSPYYPASKVAHLFSERPDLCARAEAGELCMGTIESYLIFRLTGRHVSDLSNASRTQLLNLRTLQWDDALLALFGLPKSLLPERLLPTDAEFGAYRGAPIVGVLGDSHATLFGQGCVQSGSVKVSYGTGSSVMMNIGDTPAISGGALTTAVAFNHGGKVHYQTEGNITSSCDTLVWLCDQLELFRDADEIERLAGTVPDALGVCLVPAFSGLGAPFFDVDARAILCNLSRGANRAHVARAALESVAQRDADVIEAMRASCGVSPAYLMADGGGSKNALMMQLQADLADCEVRCSAASELSALGAAYMAGIAVGLYPSLESIPARGAPDRVYVPRMDAKTRKALRAEWAKAVERARVK